MAAVLRWWLIGQLVAVVLIALSTWLGLALVGMPGAFLLGLQADDQTVRRVIDAVILPACGARAPLATR